MKSLMPIAFLFVLGLTAAGCRSGTTPAKTAAPVIVTNVVTVTVSVTNTPAWSPDPTITPEIVKEWSAPWRNWHYWPTHVIPTAPDLPGETNVLGTDIPTIYQIPGDDKWYMSFVAFNGQGYQSYVAESTNLIDWGNYQLAMPFGPTNEFDHGGRVIGGFLFENNGVKEPRVLKKKEGKYWTLYGAYPRQGGYEFRPGSEGLASSADGIHWERVVDHPVLSTKDIDCGMWETSCVYQPCLVEHQGKYFDFYNAAQRSHEQSGVAFSTDLIHWIRYPANPIIVTHKGTYDSGFASDPKVLRDGDHWVMFYFGTGFRGAHIMIAFSRDLVHWVQDPEPLYKAGGNPSGLDKRYAHKTTLVYNPKNDTFYMYYNAVPGNTNTITEDRGIGLITSKPVN